MLSFIIVTVLLLLPLISMGAMLTITILSFVLQVYGIYLGFQKAWYFGVICILFPPFALVVGLLKFFKKDVLK
jgi:hypothetical protein